MQSYLEFKRGFIKIEKFYGCSLEVGVPGKGFSGKVSRQWRGGKNKLGSTVELRGPV